MELLLVTTLKPAAPLFMDDEGAQLKFFKLEQEEPWTPRYQQQAWTPLPFLDDEIVPTAAVAPIDEEPWRAQSTISAWRSLSFQDEEGIANLGIEQEEPWTARYELLSWTARPFLDDEIGGQLKFFYLEQEEPWLGQVMALSWTPLPFWEDDLLSITPATAIDDDAPWLARFVVLRWAAVPFCDEDQIPSHLCQGPLSSGTIVNVGSGNAWVAPGNASSSNNVYTVCTMAGDPSSSDKLQKTTFGFTSPTIATITDLFVFVERHAGIGNIQDLLVKLIVGGVEAGPNKASATFWPTSDGVETYTWTQAELATAGVTPTALNASDFGVSISCATSPGDTASVDEITMTACFTYAQSGLDQEDKVVLLTQTVTWRPVLFRDEELIGTPAVFFGLEQEEFWRAAYEKQPWAPQRFLDDEIGGQLKFFFLEQEERSPLAQAVQRIPWTPFAFIDTIVDSTPAVAFGLEQEEPWRAAYEKQTWTPIVFIDTQVDPIPAVFFALEQEEPWTARYQAQPWVRWDGIAVIVNGAETKAPFAIYWRDDFRNGNVMYTYRIALNNFLAVVDPAVTDDVTLGYLPGSLWVNRAAGKMWGCTASLTGAANWIQLG